MSEISPAFLYEARHKKIKVFIGAGMSFQSGAPVASSLFEAAKEDKVFRGYSAGCHDFAGLCRQIQHNKLVPQFRHFVASLLKLRPKEVASDYRLLAFFAKKGKVNAIYSTNFDLLLDSALDAQRVPCEVHRDGSSFQEDEDTCHVIKLCGDVSDPATLVLTDPELKGVAKADAFQHLVTSIKEGSPTVFLGYSFSDDAIRVAISEAIDSRKASAVVVVSPDDPILNLDDKAFHYKGTALEFLRDLLKNLDFTLNVCHIAFAKEGFGGVETYITALRDAHEQSVRDIPSRALHFDTVYPWDCFDGFATNVKKEALEVSLPFYRATNRVAVHEIVSSGKADVIHAHSIFAAYYAQQAGFPVVLTSHSLESREKGARDADPYNRRNELSDLETSMYSMVRHIIALSDSHRRELPRDVQHHVQVVAAPLHSCYLQPAISKVDAVEKLKRYSVNLRNHGITLLWAGRAVKRKGLPIVLKVFERLVDLVGTDSAQLLIVSGDVVLAGQTLHVIQRSKTSGGSQETHERDIPIDNAPFIRVIDPGQKNPAEIMSLCYSAADVVLVPSTYEPFGYVALEALARERPVIAFDNGGLSELLADGRGILVQKPFDDVVLDDWAVEKAVEWMFESIKNHLCEDGAHHPRLSDWLLATAQKGRQYVEESYRNGALTAEMTTNLYLDAISGQGPGLHTYWMKPPSLASHLLEKIVDHYLAAEIPHGTGYFDFRGLPLKVAVMAGCRAYAALRDVQAYMEHCENDPIETTPEYYLLWWMIAQRLKTRCAMNEEMQITETRVLAELVTESFRALKIQYALPRGEMSWAEFKQLDPNIVEQMYSFDS